METLTLRSPAMFADHHVVEVRRILRSLPGVGNVYASSAFHTIEIEYDDSLTAAEAIQSALDAAGYLAQLPVPAETHNGDPASDVKPFFRHTTAYAQAGNTIAFAQDMPYAGRPLWPCPGFGLIARNDYAQEDGKHAPDQTNA